MPRKDKALHISERQIAERAACRLGSGRSSPSVEDSPLPASPVHRWSDNLRCWDETQSTWDDNHSIWDDDRSTWDDDQSWINKRIWTDLAAALLPLRGVKILLPVLQPSLPIIEGEKDYLDDIDNWWSTWHLKSSWFLGLVLHLLLLTSRSRLLWHSSCFQPSSLSVARAHSQSRRPGKIWRNLN